MDLSTIEFMDWMFKIAMKLDNEMANVEVDVDVDVNFNFNFDANVKWMAIKYVSILKYSIFYKDCNYFLYYFNPLDFLNHKEFHFKILLESQLNL